MEPFRKIGGKVQAIDRGDIDTDQIIPKQFLKRVERSGFGEFLFFDWRRYDGLELDTEAKILVAGRNFGCGSSREHAPWAIEDFGFRAVVAPSFADIFYQNCHKIGLLPVVLPEADVRRLMSAGWAEVDLEEQVVIFNGTTVPFDKHPELRHRLLHGHDDISLTLLDRDAIDAFERNRSDEAFTTRI